MRKTGSKGGERKGKGGGGDGKGGKGRCRDGKKGRVGRGIRCDVMTRHAPPQI